MSIVAKNAPMMQAVRFVASLEKKFSTALNPSSPTGGTNHASVANKAAVHQKSSSKFGLRIAVRGCRDQILVTLCFWIAQESRGFGVDSCRLLTYK